MAGRSYGGTQAQKFWEESINKEEQTRLSWHAKRKEGADGVQGKSRQYEVFAKKIENAPRMSDTKLPKIKEKQYHKKMINPLDRSLEQFSKKLNSMGNANLLVEMRPVSPHTRTLLYKGFTKEGKGRYNYLHVRSRTIPEQKYEFPLTSSWEYGWKLSDIFQKKDIKKPEYGRTRIVADTFYTRTGIPALGTV